MFLVILMFTLIILLPVLLIHVEMHSTLPGGEKYLFSSLVNHVNQMRRKMDAVIHSTKFSAFSE